MMDIQFPLPSAGVEHKLGDKAHDDPTRRWEECHFQDPLCRVQGGARVHWRLHLPLNEDQGRESAA